jgi:hypothetical protein
MPKHTIAEVIEASLRRGRYWCATTCFEVILIRGTGDIRLKFRDAVLLETANRELAQIDASQSAGTVAAQKS